MGCGSSSEGKENKRTDKALKATPSTDYEVIKELGVGASCCVKQVKHKGTGIQYAMKTVDKKCSGNKELWNTEVKLLQVVNQPTHPNVLKLEGAFEDNNYYYITTPLCSGGELFDRVVKGKFTEKKAAYTTKQMLEGLAHCHRVGVVHRDLKPENFVYLTNAEDSKMILIDFGCARQVTDDTPFTRDDACGSDYYIAPEVLLDKARTGKIWKKCDSWSIGVILYMLITGIPPFYGETPQSIFQKIVSKDPDFRHANVNVSNDCKDLIIKMLQKNPSKRISVQDALQHPWLRNIESVPDTEIPDEVKKSLANFQENCKLKKAVGRLFSDMMTESDKKMVEDVFKRFDKNSDGRLDKQEIEDMMRYIGKGGIDGQKLVDNFDEDGDGGVDLEEFRNLYGLSAAGSDQTKLHKIFQKFDTSGDGMISSGELQHMLKISAEDASGLLKRVDASGDGMIDFDEWVGEMKKIKES